MRLTDRDRSILAFVAHFRFVTIAEIGARFWKTTESRKHYARVQKLNEAGYLVPMKGDAGRTIGYVVSARPGTVNVSRSYIWDQTNGEYRPPESGLVYMARRWEMNADGKKVRATRYLATLEAARTWQNPRSGVDLKLLPDGGLSKTSVLRRLHSLGIRKENIGEGAKDHQRAAVRAPYGHRVIDGRLVSDRQEQKVARLIVELRARQNLGWKEVVERLNVDELRTRNGITWKVGRVRMVFDRWNGKF